MHAIQSRLVEIALATGAAGLAVYLHAYFVWL